MYWRQKKPSTGEADEDRDHRLEDEDLGGLEEGTGPLGHLEKEDDGHPLGGAEGGLTDHQVHVLVEAGRAISATNMVPMAVRQLKPSSKKPSGLTVPSY